MQDEVHNLVALQQVLKDLGMINDSGSVNNDFIVDIKANNALLKDLNSFNVMLATFQNETITLMDQLNT